SVLSGLVRRFVFFFFQAEDGIRDRNVTGVQTCALPIYSAEAGHGDLGMITSDDVVIALSWSGEQPEMKTLVNYTKRFAIPMIAITSNAQSSLGQEIGRAHV